MLEKQNTNMLLSEQLQQVHDSGDFGDNLEGYVDIAKKLDTALIFGSSSKVITARNKPPRLRGLLDLIVIRLGGMEYDFTINLEKRMV